MDLNIQYFPNLITDEGYNVTSPQTRDYNCISWARGLDDCWSWPPLGCDMEEDQYWPTLLPDDTKIETFIQFFEHEGFVLCESDDKDDAMICLYEKDGSCTHAARKLPNGLWTSKLGPLNDIQHSLPHSLEGDIYGKVYCYMRKNSRHTDADTSTPLPTACATR